MAAEEKPIGTIDASDLQDLIRKDYGDPLANVTEDVNKDIKKEPDVIVEGEDSRSEPVKPARSDSRVDSPIRTVEPDANLAAALRTIDELKQNQLILQDRIERSTRRTIEPEIETVEVFPNIRIIKDRTKRPVQLTPDMVKSIGLDPETAEPLEILGNAFLYVIQNVIPELTINQLDSRENRRGGVEQRRNAFEDAFPDLKDHADLVETVENNARQREGLHQKYRGVDYASQLAMRARSRIAAMRGQSLDEYMQGVKSGVTNVNRNSSVTRSRASSPSGGHGRSRSPSGMDKEMEDLYINR